MPPRPFVPSVGEEGCSDGSELLVVLEDAPVTRVGIDDEVRARNAAVQIVGQHAWDHAVVIAVRDQGGASDD